jgi:hypothetical protein
MLDVVGPRRWYRCPARPGLAHLLGKVDLKPRRSVKDRIGLAMVEQPANSGQTTLRGPSTSFKVVINEARDAELPRTAGQIVVPILLLSGQRGLGGLQPPAGGGRPRPAGRPG